MGDPIFANDAEQLANAFETALFEFDIKVEKMCIEIKKGVTGTQA